MGKIDLKPEELSELIGLVYTSAFERRQWYSLMCKITELVPGCAGTVLPFEGSKLILSGISTDNAPESFGVGQMDLNFETIFGENVLQALFRPNVDGYVARSRKYVADEVWRESDLYRKIFQPYGYESYLNLVLGTQGRRGALIGFAIPDDDDVHDRVFEILKLVSPHALRAQQLSRALAIAKRTTEVMGGFLDAIALPMLVVDGEGAFMFANAAGRRMVERGRGVSVDGRGRLALADSDASARLRARVAEVDQNLAAAGLRVAGEEEDLLLCVTPFQPSMADVGPVDRHLLSDARLFAVFVGQPDGAEVDAGLLRDTFELTEREAEVCRALLAGKSAGDIAGESGRALKTVRNQIQMIHEKLGVSTTPQLMDALSVFRTVGEMFDTGAHGLHVDGARAVSDR